MFSDKVSGSYQGGAVTYGARLRELRAERQLSLREVEERGGPNKDTMSLIERGVHKPQPQTLGRIAKALDMSVSELRFELEPAVPLAEAPSEAGQSSAERAEVIEGLAAAVDSVANRTQRRLEQIKGTDGDALVALFEETFLAQMGAERILEQVDEEASQTETAIPTMRRARVKLEHAVMQLSDLFENMIAGLEEAEEPAPLAHLAEERRRREVG
jgi:transcriptional regulator with XRE-family HTH domain